MKIIIIILVRILLTSIESKESEFKYFDEFRTAL